ncbi:MAG: RNA 2',3'-cyclic phosphodiesterase [Ignavibacteriales bacterium]|nr:RNA 2',3'-cyclic phosphodiesterase [Ignavibacteriales bacterium]
MKNRLFIALEVPKEILHQIQTIREDNIDTKYHFRWEPIDKLHFTLKFLGDVDSAFIDKIDQSLSLIVKSYNKFECEFSKFGLFKRNRIPSILWIGLKENQDLYNLANEIENEMYKLGFEKETRKFNAHLTLLRIRQVVSEDIFYNLLDISLPLIKFTTENISLMKSELLPSGSVYTKIKQFKLK